MSEENQWAVGLVVIFLALVYSIDLLQRKG